MIKRSSENSIQIYREILSVEDQRELQRFATDFEYFALHCLWIKSKDPNKPLIRFKFNEAQKYFHEKCEDMLRRKRYIRINVVKGRQQGLSTYIAGRFFWKAIFNEAKTVCIISHKADSVGSLFSKVDLFYRKCPDVMKPGRIKANSTELKLTNESEYFIVTAGSDESGRGETSHYMHESERAFFPKPDSVDAGAGQTIALFKGSERFRESTGNGKNHFYTECIQAQEGKGIWEFVFITWLMQEEYYTEPPPDFTPDPDEEILIQDHGMSYGQLQWRRDKIVELKTLRLFRQEYPLTAEEAFQSTGNVFFNGDTVARARKSKLQGYGPVVMGVDPAGNGERPDRTILSFRKGREFLPFDKYNEMTDVRLAGIVAKHIDRLGVVKCFIDYAYGRAVIDMLRTMGYGDIVEGVYFHEKPDDPIYGAKRDEMMFGLRDWLEDGETKIPDDDDMATDLSSIPDSELRTGKHRFPPKSEIKKVLGRSPDICDSMILTFARPIRGEDTRQYDARKNNGPQHMPGGGTTSTRQTVNQIMGIASQDARMKNRRGF